MANNSVTCSLLNFSSPPLSSREQEFLLSPLSKPYFHGRYGFLTVGSRRSSFRLSKPSNCVMSNYPIIRSDSSVKREPMVPPYNVLITGSTKGIGYALAKEFLKAGDNVIICSRSVERVDFAVQSFREEFGEQHVWGTKCDVREGQDVVDLVAFALKKLKYVDIWAIKMMWDQPRGGHIFNIDGAGSDGRPTPRFAAYGATKCSVVHLTKSLQPGMVTTDLLMTGATTKQAKFFINVLAEPAEVVAESLVPKIRSIPANESSKPTYLCFLTVVKAYSQIFSRIAFGARRNRYLLED